MPAQGRGGRAVIRQRPAVTKSVALTGLPGEPFAQAQQTVNRQVRQANARSPYTAPPQIPKLAKPTPKQAAVALQVAHQFEQSQLPKDPSPADRAAFRQRLAEDPRNRQYLETVAHYSHAGQAHLDAQQARRLTSEGRAQTQGLPGGAQAAVGRALRLAANAQGRPVAKPGPEPEGVGVGLPFGTVRIPTPAQLVGDLATVAPGLQGNTPGTGLVRNLLGDAAAIGELPFIGGQAAYTSAAGALKGDLGPAERLLQGTYEGLRHGAVGELLTGHPAGALHVAGQHPLFTGLEALGGVGVAGRGAGALARGLGSTVEDAGLRGALARGGNRVRPPIAYVDDAASARTLHEQRTYSAGLDRALGQKLADHLFREPVRDAEGNIVTVKDRGREVPVFKPRSEREATKLAKGRANFIASRKQGGTLAERDAVNKLVHRVHRDVHGSLAKELVHLAATGVLKTKRTALKDLQAHLDRVEEALKAGGYRTRQELRGAQANARDLRQALASEKIRAQLPKIMDAGLELGRIRREQDRRLAEHSVHPDAELRRAALSEYALAHVPGAKYDETTGVLVGKDGRTLTNTVIERHARANGRDPETLAHFPHVIASGDKSAYYQRYHVGNRPAPKGLKRTGALFNRGSAAFGREVVRDALTRSATTAHVAESIDRFIHEVGLKKPDGTLYTPKEALDASRRFAGEDGGPSFVPVRAFAGRLPAALRAQVEEGQGAVAMETAHNKLLDARRITGENADNGTPNSVLVPKHLYEGLEAHLQPSSPLEVKLQLLNKPFRLAVLAQPRWLTGNFIEPYLVRLPLSGAGLNIAGMGLDLNASRRLLQTMERHQDPNVVFAAKEMRTQLGGLFVGKKGASPRRTSEDIQPGVLHGAVKLGEDVGRIPAIKQTKDLGLILLHSFFHANRLIEGVAQRQALGKSVREDLQALTGSWAKTVKLSQAALDDVAKGLVNTAAQHRFLKAQHDLLGQYDAFSPELRRLTQSYAPFLPWVLASMRFVYWTVPAHHTAAFTALVKAGESVQKEWEAEHSFLTPGAAEGTLRDAIVRKDKGLVDLAKYTPYGATIPIAHGDISGVPNALLPQVSGAVQALRGKDPFGSDLQVAKTPGNPKGEVRGFERVPIAVNQLLEALVPGLSTARRLKEGGGTGYANSNILEAHTKPGSSHESALSRTLNPARPTYLRTPAGDGKLSAAQQRRLQRLKATGSGLSAAQQRRLERVRAAAR